MTNGLGMDMPAQEPRQGLRWAPAIGNETRSLLDRKVRNDGATRDVILAEARQVLGHCLPPISPEVSHTELVVGYVQSGKTLSFTTVAALANDNGFPVVIVISGTTQELAEQSKDRLVSDLQIGASPFTKWRHLHNPALVSVDDMRNCLRDWQDADVPPEDRRTLLLTVLKHHGRIADLTAALAALGQDANVPTLVIDDEADQASLNNLVRKGALSTTYRRIIQLRQTLLRHSFLQYTATPQANLLINLIDALSADTCNVLQPGPDYVGGQELVGRNSRFVRIIPANQIPLRGQPQNEPPETLFSAMRAFLLGACSHYLRRDPDPDLRNRSMMVHPSRLVASHHQYYLWVRAIVGQWLDLLGVGADPRDAAELMDEFQVAYRDLARTVRDIEPFDQLAQRLRFVLRRVNIRELNSETEMRDVQWAEPYWILVGGTVLDRGFTVQGLTVTYMPRGQGVGNADTIQQRARFLGYKRKYVGFCRVYLEQQVAAAYASYIEHEEHIRARLQDFADQGTPLSQLRRVFICDRNLRPTRQSVIDIDYQRPSFPSGWYAPRHPPESTNYLQGNRELFASLIRRFGDAWQEQDGHEARTSIMRHLVAEQIPLQLVYDEFLSRYQVGNIADDRRWIVALFLVDRFLAEMPEAICSIYNMSAGQKRLRRVTDRRIVNLFQGPHPDVRGGIYPGDRQIHSNDAPSIQLHNVTLTDDAQPPQALMTDVPIVTLWLPPALTRDMIDQPQGGPRN
jgi:hypothetical protein